MRPGLGVGGYCLTKDPLLASWSRQEMFNSTELKQSEVAVNINDQMPRYAFEFFKNKQLNVKKIHESLLLLPLPESVGGCVFIGEKDSEFPWND
mgnify:CR=1 FL=1